MILLNATDISKSYTVNPLLSHLSYAINEGDKIGLIGVNGTGKSTLLRVLSGQRARKTQTPARSFSPAASASVTCRRPRSAIRKRPCWSRRSAI